MGARESIGFRADPACARALCDGGFTVLSRANNHALDRGATGAQETTRCLNQAGILWTGLGRTGQDAGRPVVATSNGVRVGFLARACVARRKRKAGQQRVALLSRREILQAVSALREQVDCCVVSLHFGEEFVEHPMPQDVGLAREIVDRGVDLVLGHHPHVLQGVEKHGHGLIAYSLGNFVFHNRDGPEGESVILRCQMTGGGLAGAELIPVVIGTDYRPRPAHGEAGRRILGRMRALSEKVGTPEACEYFWDQASDRFLRRFMNGMRNQFPRRRWRYLARVAMGTRWMHVRLAAHALRRALRER